jgi:putative FmdB family regulatory protein
MPVYEYRCEACGTEFETLVLRKTEPECPSCEGQDLERVLFLPTVHSSSTRAMSMRLATKRDKAHATERMIEQQKYERAHND